jgi:hypothetical protein
MAHLHLPLVVVVIVITMPPDFKRLRGSSATRARMKRKNKGGTTEMREIASTIEHNNQI